MTGWQYAINIVCMSDAENFHSALIRGLGGKARLADALGLDRDVLTKWHVRGIPAKYWHRVLELGAAAEPPLVFTAADLERTKPATVHDPATEAA